MPLPRIRFTLPGYSRQRLEDAERPVCSATAALSCQRTWEGDDAGMPPGVLATHVGVPVNRLHLWAGALMPGARLGGSPVSPDPTKPLDPYQIEAIQSLTPAGGVLALGCGLGKTLTALAAAEAAATRTRLLIVCPLNAMGVWEEYLGWMEARWKEVMIVSQDSLHKLEGLDAAGGAIIFDEAHGMGNRNAKRTKEAHDLRAKFDFGLCLTGTLLHGGIEKALSIKDLAVPGLAGYVNRWKAAAAFGCLVEKKIPGPRGSTRTVHELEKPAGAAKEKFFEWLSHGIVSLSKDSPNVREAMDIPDQTIETVRVGEPWLSLRGEIIARLQGYLDRGEKLPEMAKLVHEMLADGVRQKINWVEANYAPAEDGSLVIFAQYTESLDALEAWCVANGRPFVRVDGSVVDDARTEAVKKFQESTEPMVFLGQEHAAGIAVTLTKAYLSIGFDHNRVGADYAQALARTCRRGQTRDCRHFDLASNAFQEAVIDRLRLHADFDASATEWQDAKRLLDAVRKENP